MEIVCAAKRHDERWCGDPRSRALFQAWTNTLITCIEAAAALVIGLAAVEAAFGAARLVLSRSGQAPEIIRLRLGRWLSLAIEFELAADVLRTAVTPTWSDLGRLAAIVVIRTVKNYFLQQEIENALKERLSLVARERPAPS